MTHAEINSMRKKLGLDPGSSSDDDSDDVIIVSADVNRESSTDSTTALTEALDLVRTSSFASFNSLWLNFVQLSLFVFF
jgi:hypothetical protein